MGYGPAYSSGHPFLLSKPTARPAAEAANDLGRSSQL